MDKGKVADIGSLKWHDSSIENYLHMQVMLMIIENIYDGTCDVEIFVNIGGVGAEWENHGWLQHFIEQLQQKAHFVRNAQAESHYGLLY